MIDLQLQHFLDKLFDVFGNINQIFLDNAIAALLIGIVICFFGIKIYNASVFWFGALIGTVFGYNIGSSFFEFWGSIICAVLAGIICAFLLKTLVRIVFFLIGLLIGGFVGTYYLGQSPWVIAMIILSGVFCLLFFNYFVIFSTSVLGALLISASILHFNPFSFSEYPYVVFGMQGALFIGGIFFQTMQRSIYKNEEG